MEKRLIALVFLIALLLISVGCKREVPEEEAPKVVRPGYSIHANNLPAMYTRRNMFREVSLTENTFYAAGIVREISGRTVKLDIYDRIIDITFGDDVSYRLTTYDGPVEELMYGDHFDEIKVGDFYYIFYNINDQDEREAYKIIFIDYTGACEDCG